jgi:protein-tyrosine-phosphatase/DNA-binding HxlR family transcriptional regulator
MGIGGTMSEHLIEVFKALSDPNRLRLFELLLLSDRTNSELMSETGLSQNLLSHHLTILADANLIRVQQSIGDARRRYYSPNSETLRSVTEWWEKCVPPDCRDLPELPQPKRVLFFCLRNAARSLIAEAIARHTAADALIVTSAGLEPEGEMSDLMLKVLAEFGIPAQNLKPKVYQELEHTDFDYVITVCDRVHEHGIPDCITANGVYHWSLHDPADLPPEQQLEGMRQLYREIEQRLGFFVQQLAGVERP